MGQGNGTGQTIFRLREGIGKFFITDINNPGASAMSASKIAVMWDIVTTGISSLNHGLHNVNVLYLDGHVDLVKINLLADLQNKTGVWPATKGARIMSILRDDLVIP